MSLGFNSLQAIETKIIYIIQNEIITNIDIKNEFKHLLVLNNNLKELNKDKIFEIANESIIREKIKKIEISKNFKEIKIDDEYYNALLKNMYSGLGLKSSEEFEKYLKNFDLTIIDLKEKIIINALWNEMIIKKYGSQIIINEDKIKKKIVNSVKQKIKEYQLSEIIYEVKNKEEIKNKYNEIIKNINEIGFQNSASIYSISETAKTGGDIGWISENSLNDKIKKNISNLDIGEVSAPIILSNGVLILKLINTKKSDINFDQEAEFKKLINYERNRQLNQFSKIYYNKIKKNLEFDG